METVHHRTELFRVVGRSGGPSQVWSALTFGIRKATNSEVLLFYPRYLLGGPLLLTEPFFVAPISHESKKQSGKNEDLPRSFAAFYRPAGAASPGRSLFSCLAASFGRPVGAVGEMDSS